MLLPRGVADVDPLLGPLVQVATTLLLLVLSGPLRALLYLVRTIWNGHVAPNTLHQALQRALSAAQVISSASFVSMTCCGHVKS